MKKLALVPTFAAAAALLATLGSARLARAEIGTADQVPAATLLLPYFEVDLANPNGINTTFTVNNASASAALAHVTLWTDEGIPSFNFDVYLTGFDSQQINLRNIFASGDLPVTADDGADPGDTISPQGALSQDINFPGASGPCDAPVTNPALNQSLRKHIRTAHTGRRSALVNGCLGAQYGDLIARGYVTVDSVTQCTVSFPSDPGYFAGIADGRNILWGDYSMIRDDENYEVGGSLVHIEACGGGGYVGSVGNGAGFCPFTAGDYTFYGRYVAATAEDQREPLATTFGARYVDGGAFDGGTDLLVWRDTKLAPTGANGKHNCKKDPSWFPLAQTDVVAFDEQENPVDLCFLPDNVSPAIGGSQVCFPLATQRVPTASGNPLGFPLAPPFSFGWIFANLSHTVVGDPFPGVAQAWVESTQAAAGRFAIGFQALPLDNALQPNSGGGGILIP